MSTVPNEILSAILAILSPSTVASVAQVSRRFNAVAERLLYSSASVRDVLSERGGSTVPWRTLRWAESMLQRGHLTEHVKRVHIRWQTAPGTRAESGGGFLAASTQVNHALTTLSSLEYLEIYLEWASGEEAPLDPLLERIIRGCSFPRLRDCSLFADDAVRGPRKMLSPSEARLPTSEVLPAFLAAAPSVRQLKIFLPYLPLPGSFPYLSQLPNTALRRLSFFRGTPGFAVTLLPGRPVRSLALLGRDEDVTRDVLVALTQGSEPLAHLDLSAISIRPALLRSIATHLPQVEVMRIRLALRHTLHYALTGIRLLTGLSSVLASFPQLRVLDLSPTASVASPTTSHSSTPSESDMEEEAALCREWRRACPTLAEVVFPSRRRWNWGQEGGEAPS